MERLYRGLLWCFFRKMIALMNGKLKATYLGSQEGPSRLLSPDLTFHEHAFIQMKRLNHQIPSVESAYVVSNLQPLFGGEKKSSQPLVASWIVNHRVIVKVRQDKGGWGKSWGRSAQ